MISLEVSVTGKSKKVQAQVEVPQNQESNFNNTQKSTVTLTAQPDEILVLAPQSRVSVAAMLEVRKNNSGVSEVLGSEQMGRQGDSDAASSLRRVTGLTLRDGKYVFVRGLGDRYSAMQLNGFNLPSPEPSRKVVPLDLFPVQILDSIQVQKSFRAPFNGEFGGGLIQLETKSRPTQSQTQMGLSFNFQDSSDFTTYQGGQSDYLAQDDGFRQLPKTVSEALKSGKKFIESSDPSSGFTKDELRQLGSSFKKNYNTFEKNQNSLPNLFLGISQKGNQEKWQWGVNSSFSYLSDIQVQNEKISTLDVPRPGELTLSEAGELSQWEIDRKLALIADTSLIYNQDHQVRMTFLGVRHGTDTTEIRDVSGPGVNDYSRRRTRTEWVERQLNVQQLQSEHKVTAQQSLQFKLGQAQIRRDSPDQKEFIYRQIQISDPFQLDPEVSGNLRTFSELNENSLDMAAIWNLKNTWGSTQLGLSYQERKRNSDTFRFQYKKDYLAGQEPDLTLPPDQIFSQTENWILVNQTGTADSYRGLNRIQSAYIEQTWASISNVEVGLGLRRETSQQNVETFFYYDPSNLQSQVESQDFDLLPSYSVVWKPDDKWRLRASYGETLARPDFRELSTVRYIDEETGFEARGNPQLRAAVLQNFDQRVEYYFEADEFISVGLFYKKFINPIEDVFLPVAGSLLKVPQNADSAENQGIEFETRWALRRINRDLRRWSLLGNVSFINSKVKLDPQANAQLTSTNRALQGQSPYILNMGLFYDRPLMG
ncbi:MAG: TonB-dependent receptor domain-containing protein, partial [Bdellovibrionales bacterium]